MYEVKHGYTFTELQSIAWACNRTAWTYGGDYLDRYDAAWGAVVEHLLTAEHRPDRHELISVGQMAVRDLVRADRRHHGVPANDPYSEYGSGKHFNRYWSQRNTPSHEDRVVDALALRQIWPRLKGWHRQSVTVYAATGDLGLAAEAEGLVRQQFVLRLNYARRAFRALWHEGERPSAMWKQDGKRRPDVAARHAASRAEKKGGS